MSTNPVQPAKPTRSAPARRFGHLDGLVRSGTGVCPVRMTRRRAGRRSNARGAARGARRCRLRGWRQQRRRQPELLHLPRALGLVRQGGQDCSQQSNGRYTITVNTLPSDADQQRQQLVRRLVGAGQLHRHHRHGRHVDGRVRRGGLDQAVDRRARRRRSRRARSPVPIKTATYKGQALGRRRPTPTRSCSGTARTWSRRRPRPGPRCSRPAPPSRKQAAPSRSRARQYEGLTVWFNSLNASAGGSIIDPRQRDPRPPASRRPTIMKTLASRPRDPALSSRRRTRPPGLRDRARPRSRSTTRSSGRAPRRTRRRSSRTWAWRPARGVDPGKPRQGTIGGINFGRRRLHEAPERGLRRRGLPAQPANQKHLRAQGRPAADPQRRSTTTRRWPRPYPFKDLIRRSSTTRVGAAADAAYADISLAISKGLTPPDAINPKTIVSR